MIKVYYVTQGVILKCRIVYRKAFFSFNIVQSLLRLRLEYVIENDKPYLDEDLTLKKLADKIHVTDKQLSTLLNQYMNVSFYDLINNLYVRFM